MTSALHDATQPPAALYPRLASSGPRVATRLRPANEPQPAHPLSRRKGHERSFSWGTGDRVPGDQAILGGWDKAKGDLTSSAPPSVGRKEKQRRPRRPRAREVPKALTVGDMIRRGKHKDLLCGRERGTSDPTYGGILLRKASGQPFVVMRNTLVSALFDNNVNIEAAPMSNANWRASAAGDRAAHESGSSSTNAGNYSPDVSTGAAGDSAFHANSPVGGGIHQRAPCKSRSAKRKGGEKRKHSDKKRTDKPSPTKQRSIKKRPKQRHPLPTLSPSPSGDDIDPKMIGEAMEWIFKTTGERITIFMKLHGLDGCFPNCLKSGRILCQLVNKIQPKTVSRINFIPIPQFEKENIASYLMGCVELGMAKDDLFAVSDLYEEKNLSVVLKNIYTLKQLSSQMKRES